MFASSTLDGIVALVALGVVALLALVLAGYLGVGLFQARSLVRREFSAYFLSPIAYVVLVVFLTVTGYLFYQVLFRLTTSGPEGIEYPLQLLLGDDRFWLVFLFIPPLLTMRLFAEERGTGTLEVLMTTPLRDWQVVLSKYVACLGFYVVLWLPTLLYVPVLVNAQAPVWRPAWTPWSITLLTGLGLMLLALLSLLPRLGTTGRLVSLGLFVVGAVAAGVGGWMHYTRDGEHLLEIPIDVATGPGPVLASYLGLFLAGAMFLALGLFVSSLVRSQMVAALISLVLGLVFIFAGFWHLDLDTGNPWYRVVYFFSVPLHFHRDFSRGLVDTRHLVLYGSVTLCALFLTVRSLESRRWR
jgi:ABC-type transport system involved in multi-copper enzyme maturation permease subunit